MGNQEDVEFLLGKRLLQSAHPALMVHRSECNKEELRGPRHALALRMWTVPGALSKLGLPRPRRGKPRLYPASYVAALPAAQALGGESGADLNEGVLTFILQTRFPTGRTRRLGV